jgi:P4 family phage/plasmid primase-like protien
LFPSALAQEPTENITILQFIKDVRDGRWAANITPLRHHIAMDDRASYDAKKRLLPAVTISCHCMSRERDLSAEAKAITHSGWLQADFDLKDNLMFGDPEEAMAMRASLINDPYVGAVFVGPSGEGLKALVYIGTENHKDSWFAAELHFREQYKLTMDKATKDPLRLCFVSFDPLAEMSEFYCELPIPEKVETEERRWTPPIESTAEDIAEMLSYIPPRPDYDTWLRIASAVWSVLPAGEGSMLLNKWSPEEQDGEYMGKHKARLTQIGIGTLAMMAQQHGFDAKEAYRRRRWAGRIRFADSTRSPFQKQDEEKSPEITEISRERIIRAFNDQQVGDALLWCEIRAGQRIYNINAKLWMYYQDGVWLRDSGRITTHDISHTLKEIYSALADSVRDEIIQNPAPPKTDDPRTEQLASIHKRIKDLGSSKYLAGVETLAERHLYTSATDFDQNRELLVVSNGTIDFKEGHKREHQSSDLATIKSNINFDIEAQCPKWDAFLERCIPNLETREYLARAVGYSLTGRVDYEVLFFCYGHGANGKSTFFSVIEHLLGDFMTSVPIAALLTTKSDNNHDYHKAGMEGKRVVLTDEIPANRSFAEDQIKGLTGGDKINARRPYEVPYTFQSSHKLWMMGNHKPDIKGTDDGIWRRVHLIPWSVTIPKAEQRPKQDLLDDLTAELPGILNWAIMGLISSRDIGLQPPLEVIKATEEYRADNDQLSTFLSENVIQDKGSKLHVDDIHKRYRLWCDRNGERPRYTSTRKLSAGLKEKKDIFKVEVDRKNKPFIRDYKMTEAQIEHED